jgi:hypothetical protein
VTDITTEMNMVHIEGQTITRPSHVSVKQWMDFWEAVADMPDRETDQDTILDLREQIEDLRQEVEGLRAERDRLQADLDSVDRT